MPEKDVYCLALYFHFPQTKSYNTGLFSLTSIPGNPSASTWHTTPAFPRFSHHGATGKSSGLLQTPFHLQRAWRKWCDGNRRRDQTLHKTTAIHRKVNLKLQKRDLHSRVHTGNQPDRDFRSRIPN